MNALVKERIQQLINDNRIVLFMKGTPQAPYCGFSAAVVNILKELGVEFIGVNVLQDNEVREGIKEFSDWPTIPQLYIEQQFLGGCDIVKDMYATGELQSLLRL